MASIIQSCVRRFRTLRVLCFLLFVSPFASADDDLDTLVEENDSEFECSLFDFEGTAGGYVDLSFTVTKEGTVRDPYVIRSDACDESVIPSMERVALESVLDFKYRPKVVEGEAVEVEGVRTRITFRLDEDEEDEGEPEASDEAVQDAAN